MPCPEKHQTIYIQEQEVETVKTFKYVGSLFDANGGAEKYVNNRVKIAWSRWREITGVMCDRNIPTRDSLSPVLFVTHLEATFRDFRHTLQQRPREDINMPHCMAYADDVDFISSSINVFLNEVQRLAPGCLLQWHLIINESKTDHTNIHRRNTHDVEQWRKTRKLGSLLGDVEDVTRRKQLAAVAFQRLWSLCVRKRHISEGLRLRLTTPLSSRYSCTTWVRGGSRQLNGLVLMDFTDVS